MERHLLQPIETNRGPKFREVAYGILKDAILAGQIGGDQPLVEEQLAAQLKISRTPVREALAVLEHEGLIAPREGHGRGLFVKVMDRQLFAECFTAAEVVEADLVRRAARLANEELVQSMVEVVERGTQQAEFESMPQFFRSVREFLRLLGLAAENAPLASFLVSSQSRVDLFLLSNDCRLDQCQMRESMRELMAILNAIIRRDPHEAARKVAVRAQAMSERWSRWLQDPDEMDDY